MFESLGLASAENEVYVAAVGNPQSNAHELAAITGLTQTQTGRALARLIERSMVSRLPGRPSRFLAAAPDVAIGELIGAVETELWRARDRAQRLMEVHRAASRYTQPQQSLEVLVGRDDIGRRVAHLQATARVQVRGFDKPPYIVDPGANLDTENKRLRQGIKYRVIYTREAIALPGRLHADIFPGLREGELARVRGDLPLKMLMADDRMAIIPIGSNSNDIDAAYVIHPSCLLEALITLFEAEWDRGMPLTVDGLPNGANGPDKETRELLTLLASGMTDQGIARSLGWSMRTAQRRIRTLMEELGAETRFQMGMSAKARGWL